MFQCHLHLVSEIILLWQVKCLSFIYLCIWDDSFLRLLLFVFIKKNKKGLRQCAKLQDLGKGLLWFLRGENKVKFYFAGFVKNLTSKASHEILLRRVLTNRLYNLYFFYFLMYSLEFFWKRNTQSGSFQRVHCILIFNKIFS